MTRKRTCVCGHDIDTHYKDPQTGARCACTGLRCDCELYDEGTDRARRVLPANNYDEKKTAYGGGRPHLNCKCEKCIEWEFEEMRRQLQW